MIEPQPSPSKPKRRIWFALAAVAFGIVVALVVTQIAIWALLNWRARATLATITADVKNDPGAVVDLKDVVYPVEDNDVVYRLKPGSMGLMNDAPIHINASGFNDDPVADPKPENGLRIAALGDSFSFGWRLPQDKIWSNRLEAALGELAGARPVEIVNCGVPGYNSVMEVAAFIQDDAKLQCDAVVVQYFVNDGVVPNFMLRDYRDTVSIFRPATWKSLGEVLSKPMEFVLVFFPEGDVHQPANGPETLDPAQVPEKYMHHLGREAVAGAYRKLADYTRERGIPVWILLPGDNIIPGVKSDPRYDEVRSICAEAGLPIVECYSEISAFLEETGLDKNFIMSKPAFDTHPGALAQDVMARCLLEPVAKALLPEAGDDAIRRVASEMKRRDAELAERLTRRDPEAIRETFPSGFGEGFQ